MAQWIRAHWPFLSITRHCENYDVLLQDSKQSIFHKIRSSSGIRFGDDHHFAFVLPMLQLQQYMKISLFVLFLLVCLGKTATAVECPASHFTFVGKYALGRQDQLNKTFTKIAETIQSLPNVTYNVSGNIYTIFNAKPSSFYYRDSFQKTTILGNDTIVNFGGRLEVYLDFQWKKQGSSSTNGSGKAFGLSNSIDFAKSIVVASNGSFFSYELKGVSKVEWKAKDPFQLTRIEPPSTTVQDKDNISLMLQRITNMSTVCDQLENAIDKVYMQTLSNELHEEHIPLSTEFDYVWARDGKPNITMHFTRRGIDVKLASEGVRLYYEVQAANDSQWKCGNRSVPTSPFQPEVYGTSQEFISYDFYENVMRSAISKGYLDADLTRENWESRMFQFYAGDLYEVLDKIQSRYFASQPVLGNCKASYQSLKVAQSSNKDTLNISLSFDCELSIQRTKVVDFSVGLQLQVQGIPMETSLNFKLRSHAEKISIYPYTDYRILSEELGMAMIRHSINRLYEGPLFGSGWPLSPPRDYPIFTTLQNSTFVYDPSHLGTSPPYAQAI